MLPVETNVVHKWQWTLQQKLRYFFSYLTYSAIQLKEILKILEKLNENGKWKWLLHYRESKNLKEDVRSVCVKGAGAPGPMFVVLSVIQAPQPESSVSMGVTFLRFMSAG